MCEHDFNTLIFPSIPSFVLYELSGSISPESILPNQIDSPSSENENPTLSQQKLERFF